MFKGYGKFIARVAWLLVIVGFFMPVSCGQNGVALARVFVENRIYVVGISLPLILLVAVLALIGAVASYKKNGTLELNTRYETAALVADMVFALIPYIGIRVKGNPVHLDSGATMIVAGWIGVAFGIILDRLPEKKIPAVLEIPDGTTRIMDGAFKNLDKLKAVIIPGTVARIGDYSFSGCENLITLKIPEGVAKIGGHAFDGCYRLESVTIPGSADKISGSAFLRCYSLGSVKFRDPDGWLCGDKEIEGERLDDEEYAASLLRGEENEGRPLPDLWKR